MATIRKRGDKWQVQVRRKGHALITKSFHLRKNADLWARQIESQIDLGDIPSPVKYNHGKTLKDLLELYRDKITVNKLSGPSELYIINQFNRLKLAQKLVNEVTHADFVEYKEQRLKQVKPSTFNREINVIKHALKIAEKEWGINIKKNPLEDFTQPKVKNERQRRLKTDEYGQIMNAISTQANPYLRLVIDFAIETGMRRGEILSVKKEHLDFDSKTLLIPITKTG